MPGQIADLPSITRGGSRMPELGTFGSMRGVSGNWHSYRNQVFTGETFLQTEPPIDPSSLTRWRKRLGEAGIEELLAETIEAAKRAGVIKAIHKEGLVIGARSMPGNPYDGHTLAEALEQATILSDVKPEVAVVDRGYKGVAIDGVKIYHPGLRRGITHGLRAMSRRRSAIEPAIGHMKADGKLDRNWLKGALGDAMHAVLCGAGHNLRMILRKLRLFYALFWSLCACPRTIARPGCSDRRDQRTCARQRNSRVHI
ncbi:IS5 family transposase [Paraburkholderia youngii]